MALFQSRCKFIFSNNIKLRNLSARAASRATNSAAPLFMRYKLSRQTPSTSTVTMVGILEWSKNTLRSRTQPRRSESAMPYFNVSPPDNSPPATPTPAKRSSLFVKSTPKTNSAKIDNKHISQVPRNDGPRSSGSSQLDETMSIFFKLKKSRSSKALQLPPIPHLKPMTMTSLLGEDRDAETPNAQSKGPITRKPVPQNSPSFSTPLSTQQTAPRFNPREPLQDPRMHASAKAALKKRYQSKLTVDFEVPNGLSVRDYDFRWVDANELERKVLEDIAWVRERYAQIGKEEPSDEDIIWWYDVEIFDEGSQIGIAL